MVNARIRWWPQGDLIPSRSGQSQGWSRCSGPRSPVSAGPGHRRGPGRPAPAARPEQRGACPERSSGQTPRGGMREGRVRVLQRPPAGVRLFCRTPGRDATLPAMIASSALDDSLVECFRAATPLAARNFMADGICSGPAQPISGLSLVACSPSSDSATIVTPDYAAPPRSVCHVMQPEYAGLSTSS